MDAAKIKNLITQQIKNAKVSVTGNDGKYKAVVISDSFADLNQVSRHQTVYATVSKEIASGEIHALSIAAYTCAEYEASE